jgi:hypothetical protein
MTVAPALSRPGNEKNDTDHDECNNAWNDKASHALAPLLGGTSKGRYEIFIFLRWFSPYAVNDKLARWQRTKRHLAQYIEGRRLCFIDPQGKRDTSGLARRLVDRHNLAVGPCSYERCFP